MGYVAWNSTCFLTRESDKILTAASRNEISTLPVGNLPINIYKTVSDTVIYFKLYGTF